MFAALNLLFCLVVPAAFALLSTLIALTATKRHVSRRQLVITAFVVTANVSSVSVLFQSMYTGQSISMVPLVLIATTLVLAVVQLIIATAIGFVSRLRQAAA